MPMGVQRHSPCGETSQPGSPYLAVLPNGTNIDGPNGATSPAWQLMHWSDVMKSEPGPRFGTAWSCVTGGRAVTSVGPVSLRLLKMPANAASALRLGRSAGLGRTHFGWASATSLFGFLTSFRHESSTRNRSGSPGKPATFRSAANVNSLPLSPGSVPGEWVAAWQRTQ